MQIIELRKKLSNQKNKIGLVGGKIDIEEYDEFDKDISAYLNPNGWDINISIRKGFNPIQDRRQKAYARKKQIKEGLETMISDMTCHEFAHWQLPFGSEKGCPYDSYNHDKIVEAIKFALPENKQSQKGYVANAFEDIIINPRVKEFKGDFSGQVLFWDNEGKRCKNQGLEHYTAFYEAFVKLNMHLFGDNLDKALLKRHYSNDSKVDSAVSKTISDLNLTKNIQNTDFLFNKPNWSHMVEVFAKNLTGLLDEISQERLSAFSSERNGNSGQESEQQEPGNSVEEKSKTNQGKEDIAYGRYSGNEEQSTNLTSFEQLDALYKRLAKPLTIKVEAMSRNQSLKINPLTYRPFNEEKDTINKIKLSKLFLTEQGLRFAYPNKPLTINAKQKFQRKNFPDFKMIMLDNSGSMAQGIDSSGKGNTEFIPWGDNSKYHYALLGYRGIEKFLQDQGIAQYIEHGLSLFSSQTRFKKSDFKGMDDVWKLALSPEFGNTYIDIEILENTLEGDGSFVLSLSDGEIGNWKSKKERFKDLIKKNYYAHIQLGGKTEFTEDLEAWNSPVFYSNGKDLSRLMVDITSDTYHKFTRGTS